MVADRHAESVAPPDGHQYACDSPRCACYQEGYAQGVRDGKLATTEHNDGP